MLLVECKSYLIFKRWIDFIVFLRSLKILFKVQMKLQCALFGASFSVRTATTKTQQYFLHDRLSLATIKFEATLWSQIQVQLR